MKSCRTCVALMCLVFYLSVVSCKVRTKRYVPEDDVWQVISDLGDLERLQQKDKRTLTSSLNPGFLWSSTARWFPESYDYGALADKDLDKRVFDNLGGYEIHSYRKRDSQTPRDNKFDGIRKALRNQQSPRLKRLLDTLGGFQVHGWKKRSLDSLGGYQVHGWKKRALDSLGGFQVHGWKKRSVNYPDFDTLEIRNKRDAENTNEIDVEERKDKQGKSVNKRTLDDLGSFQIHGWKRSDTSDETNSGGNFDKKSLENLGSFQIHGWKKSEGFRPKIHDDIDQTRGADKKSLENLGSFQIHGWKRGLDDLGGFQVHGWKRAMDSLGGFNVHGWKRSEEDPKRSLENLGNFQVHGWKRSDEELQDPDVTADKKSLDSLGSFQVHGWKRDDGSIDENYDSFKETNDKRLLDSLGSFQVHGYKRGLDHLGGFQVHGWKRSKGQSGVQSNEDTQGFGYSGGMYGKNSQAGEYKQDPATAVSKAPAQARVRRTTDSQSHLANLAKDEQS